MVILLSLTLELIDRHDTANGIGGGIFVYLRTELKILCLDNYSEFAWILSVWIIIEQ